MVKRFLLFLEQYLPPIDQTNVSDSTLDYLDELHDYLKIKANMLWSFFNGSDYTTITNEWITRAEQILTNFFTLIPFQEILNFFDAVASNSNDRRALIIVRYERYLWLSNTLLDTNTPPVAVTNAQDIFEFLWKKALVAITSIDKILHDTVTGVKGEVCIFRQLFLKLSRNKIQI